MSEDDRGGLIGWMAAAGVIAIIILLLFWAVGCADKKTNHYIQQLLPVVDKPPVECPKGQCRHGQNCEPCAQGEAGD